MGFGLMTGFIGLSDVARDYTSQFTITHTSVHSHVFTSRCSVAAHFPLGSRTIPGLSYQLLTATTHYD
jgi:hypothetical protein